MWSDKTRHGHLLTLRTLFEFAVSRFYLVGNPAAAVDLPMLMPVEKGVHSPAQVKKFLDSCADASVQRFFAVRYFAGLRGSEAKAISETDIRLEHNVIVVNPEICKTRRRRLVTVQANLKAWLEFTAARGGTLPLRPMENKMTAAVKASGVPWPDNVTRHSFCSYHLQHFKKPGETAMEAGHSEQVMFTSYRELLTIDGELITAALAKEFWDILPEIKKPVPALAETGVIEIATSVVAVQ